MQVQYHQPPQPPQPPQTRLLHSFGIYLPATPANYEPFIPENTGVFGNLAGAVFYGLPELSFLLI